MEKLKFNGNIDVIQEESDDKNAVKFVIKPLDRGYGITFGNTLRRVLLSSIPGFAISRIKIEGVKHEFQVLDGVYEEIMSVILNLKKIVFSYPEFIPDFEKVLTIDVVGPKNVVAGDFVEIDGLTVVNKEAPICTIAAGVHFSMEAVVNCGTGYVSGEENRKAALKKSYVDPEQIYIDSIYGPIVKVSCPVEKERGDLDKLVLNIETNGAISAKEALGHASKMIVDYMGKISELCQLATNYDHVAILNNSIENSGSIYAKKQNAFDPSQALISSIDLSARTKNALMRQLGNATKVSDIMEFGEEALRQVDGLGSASLQELSVHLHELGINGFLDKEYDKTVKASKKGEGK